ncbi:unnamed protein product [Alternaria alternata]
MELKHVAILGAGGNVGNTIITELLKDGARFTITAITRSTSSYTPPSTAITHRTVDYTSFSSLQAAFQGQDAVVNCVTGGATHYELSKLIIDAAVAAGVKFFFANEFVGDITREEFTRLPEAFVGSKCRIREYLEELGREKKMAWCSLNGGPFFDMWLMKGPAGFVQSTHLPYQTYPTTMLVSTVLETNPYTGPLFQQSASQLATCSATLFLSPTGPFSSVPSPHLTQNMLLRVLEKLLDTSFSVEHVDLEKIHRHALVVLEKWKEGGEQEEGKVQMGKAMKGLAISNQFYGGEDDVKHLGQAVQNEIVGVKTMQVEDAVREALEQYGKECQVVQGMFNVEACDI